MLCPRADGHGWRRRVNSRHNRATVAARPRARGVRIASPVAA